MKKGWEYIELHKKCIVQNGFAFNSKEFNSVNGVPLIRIRDIKRGFSETFTSEICSSDYYVENGNLLVGMDGDFNVGIWNGGHALLNQRVCMIKPSNNYNVKFLYYYLPNILNRINQKTSFSTVKHLSSKQVNKINIPDISENEQRRIVSYLDSSFDLIDKIKDNASKSLSEAKALFQSALAEAMEPKEGWEEKTLGEICTFIRGPFGGSLKKECFKVEGYAVYEQQNAIYNRFNFRYFIDEIKYKEMSRFKVAANDLIMSCSGTIGKVAIIPKKFKEGIINQALLKLTPSNVIDSLFLKYLMESKVFNDQLLHFTEGVAIKNVASVAILKGINVNYPPLPTQKQIVSRLDSLSSKVRAIEEKYQKMIVECDALKQAMLREVFE